MDCAVPFRVAVMVTVVSEATGEVVMLNVAEVAPLGMLTDAGTDAAEGLELDNRTVSPLPREMLTVPCEACPPKTVLGEMATFIIWACPPDP